MAIDMIDRSGMLDMEIIWLTLCLDILPITAQGVIHLFFVSRLSGKRLTLRHLSAYLFLLSLIWSSFAGVLSQILPATLSELFAISAELLALYGVSRFFFKLHPSPALTAATLAVYITQLSFGIVDSLESPVLPGLLGDPLLPLLLLLGTLLSFMICVCCYRIVLKTLSLNLFTPGGARATKQKEGAQPPYMALLLLPGLSSFAAELYILQTAYHIQTVPPAQTETGKHLVLLLLQLLGLGALFCALYAYRRICQGLQAQAALASLTQAAEAQRVYITEAQMRYGQTRSFRHDLKNHLAVLHGLLDSGKEEEAKAYLRKLDTVSSSLSFPYQTGNPIVDILLSEKLGMAKANGILAEASLLLPDPCGIDDLDLCVIFANALDNAIAACRSLQGDEPQTEAPLIRITGERQGELYRLEFANTCPAGPLPPMGTGLSNIKTAAEKYHGAMLIEKEGHLFRLDILLATGTSKG